MQRSARMPLLSVGETGSRLVSFGPNWSFEARRTW